MEVVAAKCTNCGANLEIEIDNQIIECNYCMSSMVLKEAVAFKKVTLDYSDNILKYRQNLKEAILKNSIDEILRTSRLIKDLLPDDITANYYFAYAKQNKNEPAFMYEFLKQEYQFTKEAIFDISNHIIIRSDLRDKSLIEAFFQNNNPSYLKDFSDTFEKRFIEEDQYSIIPRDFFICHSSKQYEFGEKVLNLLEKDGYIGWISTRDLRPDDNENYWNNIEEVISLSKLVIVVSSREAMISKDVQREIKYAKSNNIQLLEIKIDEHLHTSLFKYFFDGLKWIEAFDVNHNYEDEIKKRVFNLLHSSNTFSIETKDDIIKTNRNSNINKSLKFTKLKKKLLAQLAVKNKSAYATIVEIQKIEPRNELAFFSFIFLGFYSFSYEETLNTINDYSVEDMEVHLTYLESELIDMLVLYSNHDYSIGIKNKINERLEILFKESVSKNNLEDLDSIKYFQMNIMAHGS